MKIILTSKLDHNHLCNVLYIEKWCLQEKAQAGKSSKCKLKLLSFLIVKQTFLIFYINNCLGRRLKIMEMHCNPQWKNNFFNFCNTLKKAKSCCGIMRKNIKNVLTSKGFANFGTMYNKNHLMITEQALS